VARDANPSRCFAQLAEQLGVHGGYTVVTHLGDGKPLVATDAIIEEDIRSSDAVLIGMSQTAELSAPEILAAHTAQAGGVPFGFFGDNHRSWAKANSGMWLQPFANDATFYLGITQEDADTAEKTFPNAELFGTGNPVLEAYAFAGLPSKEDLPDALRGKRIILAPGNKYAVDNIWRWTMLLRALEKAGVTNVVLAMTTHPGDGALHSIDSRNGQVSRLYDELLDLARIPSVLMETIPTQEIVPHASLIVEFDTSFVVAAAYHQIPVITMASPISEEIYRRTYGRTVPSGAKAGIAQLVTNDVTLSKTILRLLTPEGSAPMRQQQQRMYPKPEKRGTAIHLMASVLSQVTGS